jgi:hypothetical protein
MSGIKKAALAVVVLAFVVSEISCASDSKSGAEPAVKPLDASHAHYGKTYAEWAAAWVQYVNAYHKPDCANPFMDTTGKNCAVDQDPKSPVFFLVGAFGGVVKRKCTVPKDKALFLPIASVSGDNAGVPTAMLVSDAGLKTYVQATYDNLAPKRLWLRVDGEDIGNLEMGGIRSAPYTLTFTDGMNNAYACNKVDGVVGKFNGYVGGYWALLPALSPGVHDIQYGITRGVDPLTGDPSQPTFMLDVSYELDVQ